MRLKVDENLPEEVAEVLRQEGHDADTVADEGLTGADDAELLDRCIIEKRSLFTLDLDFANTRAYPPGDYLALWCFDCSVKTSGTCWPSAKSCSAFWPPRT